MPADHAAECPWLPKQDYRSHRWVTIHYPGGIDDSLRRSVIADLPGLRLAKDIALFRDATSAAQAGGPGAAARVMGGLPGARLNLRLHNKVPLCRAC